MARLIGTLQRNLSSSSSSKTLINDLQPKPYVSLLQSRDATSISLFPPKPYSTRVITKSPLQSNILRILRNEIDYQSEYAPPHQPAGEFKTFMVEDHPGEQWITMRGEFGDEHIKMEATMFDGFVTVPKGHEDSTGHDVRLHMSLLVDISKEEGGEEIEFVCSAWPDCIEIQKLYILRSDKMCARPYMGPNIRSLKKEVQKTFQEFLQVRGINDELSGFLHEYMMNKDRIELIRWLKNLESFMAK